MAGIFGSALGVSASTQSPRPFIDEQHLRTVLTEFVQYYNQERPHRTLGLQTPQLKVRPTTGIVRSRPVLNGLHHVYERAA